MKLLRLYIPLVEDLLFTDMAMHIYRFIQSVTERCILHLRIVDAWQTIRI
jgi:hypothetical protein